MPSSITKSTDAPPPAPRGAAFDSLVAALKTHRWFLCSALASLLVCGWICTGGTGQLLVTEPLGDLYDHQAAGLLKGKLDLPAEALSFEAFVFEGKRYTYFGVTPAILRIPFAVLGIAFGQLSRPFMLAYVLASLLAAYLILLHALRLAGSPRPAPRPWLVVLFVVNVGIGNTFLFLCSRTYVYHEAILCGSAFALWSVWCGLRHLAQPDGRWWVGALVCGVLAVHARPPVGLFALTFLGLVGCVIFFQRWQAARSAARPRTWMDFRHPVSLAVWSAVGLLSFNGLSYLKYRSFGGWPLKYHMQYDAARIARFEGRQFHLSNVRFGIDAYLLHPNFTVSKYFPYLRLTGGNQARFPEAKMDIVEPMLAIPYAMPGLFALATVGCAAAALLVRNARTATAMLWLAAVPMSLVMLAAVAHSHRYTADFCPWLIGAAAFAVAAMESLPPVYRRFAGGAATLLSIPAVLANVLLALNYQGETVWGVPTQYRGHYAALRERVDRFFGVSNPQGYGAVAPEVRRIDAAYYDVQVVALAKNSPKQPQAIAIYERELRDQLYFKDSHFELANLYTARNDIPKAITSLEQALRIDPNAPKLQAKLGELLALVGRVPEAIERYKAALQLAPNYAIVRNNLGAAYASLGQINEAIRELELAVAADPNYVDARVNLAKLRQAYRPTP